MFRVGEKPTQTQFAIDSIIDNNQSINIKYTRLSQGTFHGEPFQMNNQATTSVKIC